MLLWSLCSKVITPSTPTTSALYHQMTATPHMPSATGPGLPLVEKCLSVTFRVLATITLILRSTPMLGTTTSCSAVVIWASRVFSSSSQLTAVTVSADTLVFPLHREHRCLPHSSEALKFDQGPHLRPPIFLAGRQVTRQSRRPPALSARCLRRLVDSPICIQDPELFLWWFHSPCSQQWSHFRSLLSLCSPIHYFGFTALRFFTGQQCGKRRGSVTRHCLAPARRKARAGSSCLRGIRLAQFHSPIMPCTDVRLLSIIACRCRCRSRFLTSHPPFLL